MAVSIAMKLHRLTKLGNQLVRKALQKFEGISDFAIAKNQHRQNFTKFHNGGGVRRDTAETYCNALEIPNWKENWDKIIELMPDAIADWSVYDDRWMGRKKLVGSLIEKISANCRLLLLLGITGIGKTA
ncbi:MAG: hypothetical protein ACK5BG_18600 [Pseudanabaena sp.]|jgi:flagellar biosynthesis GTPase FlhF